MSTSTWTPNDTQTAMRLWDEYQASHDVSDLKGRTAGIDPHTGRVWFGDSAIDIARQMDAEGQRTPLYFVRVGYDYYLRKGRRQQRSLLGHGSCRAIA
jgi:hypothetical protein